MKLTIEQVATYAKLKQSVIDEIANLIGKEFDLGKMRLTQLNTDESRQDLYYNNSYMGKFTMVQVVKKDGTPTVLFNFTPAYDKEST